MSHRKTNLESKHNRGDEGDKGVEGDTLMEENSTVISVNKAVAKKLTRMEKEDRDLDLKEERQRRDDDEFILSLPKRDRERLQRWMQMIRGGVYNINNERNIYYAMPSAADTVPSGDNDMQPGAVPTNPKRTHEESVENKTDKRVAHEKTSASEAAQGAAAVASVGSTDALHSELEGEHGDEGAEFRTSEPQSNQQGADMPHAKRLKITQ
jgi:hypothetical protein